MSTVGVNVLVGERLGEVKEGPSDFRARFLLCPVGSLHTGAPLLDCGGNWNYQEGLLRPSSEWLQLRQDKNECPACLPRGSANTTLRMAMFKIVM